MSVSLKKLTHSQQFKLIADLTHERDELQRKLATAMESVDSSLRALSAETARNNALAAENHEAKRVIGECKAYFIAGITNRIRPTNEGYLHMLCDTFMDETPATDAAIADIRAQGVDAFVATLQKHVTEGDFVGYELPVIQGAIDAGGEFAETLRKESGQ